MTSSVKTIGDYEAEDNLDDCWMQLFPPTSSHLWVLRRLDDLTAVVRESSTLHKSPTKWEEFEVEQVRGAYAAVAAALNLWSAARQLPTVPATYVSRRETSQAIEDGRNMFLSPLPLRELSLRDAAAAACWCWATRRLGTELVDNLFIDPWEWEGGQVPHFYPGITMVDERLWEIAEGRDDDLEPVAEVLEAAARTYGARTLDQEWLVAACNGECGDHPGMDPALPILLWWSRLSRVPPRIGVDASDCLPGSTGADRS